MRFLLLSCVLFLCFQATAQDKNRIFGVVAQRGTGSPVPNASVFVSGSSLGTMTDSAGHFELKGIPAGSFELIVSSVNYTTMVYPFSADKLPLRLNVQLDPKVTELDEVTVEPFDPNGWQNWGKLFIENFMGTSYASRQCRITNVKALRFRYNQKKKILTVIADEPLEIVNDYLGYTVRYQLEEFTFNQNESSIFYYGYTLFKDMAAQRSRVPSRFMQRRMDIYKGSMAHFMRSLYHDILAQEGFEVRRLTETPNYEKERVKKIMVSQSRRNISSGGVTVMKLGIAPPADSVTYYRSVMQQPNQIRNLGPLLNADSLLAPAGDSAKQLEFENFLHITYKKGVEEGSYVKSRMMSRKPGFPVSVIFLKEIGGIVIEPNGYYYPPSAIFSMEYWGWSEKIAHLLPVDYQLPASHD